MNKTNMPSEGVPAAGHKSQKLKLARRNTFIFMSFLYLQDVFWLSASRIQYQAFDDFYQVSNFAWDTVGYFILLALFYAFGCYLIVKVIKPLPKLTIPYGAIQVSVVIAIFANIAVFMLVGEGARYTSGALTGFSGVVYYIGRGINFAVFALLIRFMYTVDHKPPMGFLVALVISFALTIDGLASALFLAVFVMLMYKNLGVGYLIRQIVYLKKGAVLLILMSFVAGFFLWLGLISKFAEVPDILYVTRWAVSRFSIQAEQMYAYLAGNSSIGSEYGYIELVTRAISDRMQIVIGNTPTLEYPRNVSEAIHFDVKGSYGSGSSPGIFMNTALQGMPFFIIVPIFYCFLYVQYFYGFLFKLGIWHLALFSFLFKALHTNFSELLVFISPNTVYIFLFVLVALTRLNPKSSA